MTQMTTMLCMSWKTSKTKKISQTLFDTSLYEANPKDLKQNVVTYGAMKQLKRLTRSCCSSIIDVYLCIFAVGRVPRILIALHWRTRMKITLDKIVDKNSSTSIAYQALSF